ncbi:hypothetical protein ACFWPV_36185 [Streptomyces uncialis]|uniref:hypothetical protein n=1 Tax=Streptomyces uncialis TaxID=1048205 RepID=UPI0036670F7B
MFFQDPDTHDWHEMRWNGLPDQGEVPAFSDARVKELLREAKALGPKPKSDAELLPLLLKLIGGYIPVEQWPTQMTKKQKKDQAREDAQHTAARSDRPVGPERAREIESPAGSAAAVPSTRWARRAREAGTAVDEERRRRREQAVPQRLAAPARLGDRARRTSLLAPLPGEDTDDLDGSHVVREAQ